MERNANHLKIKSCKVNNGRGESPISHVPSENSWLSQSAHNYHRALACASATAARRSIFYDLTFEGFRVAHVFIQAAQPQQFFFFFYFRSDCNFNSDTSSDPIHNCPRTRWRSTSFDRWTGSVRLRKLSFDWRMRCCRSCWCQGRYFFAFSIFTTMHLPHLARPLTIRTSVHVICTRCSR